MLAFLVDYNFYLIFVFYLVNPNELHNRVEKETRVALHITFTCSGTGQKHIKNNFSCNLIAVHVQYNYS